MSGAHRRGLPVSSTQRRLLALGASGALLLALIVPGHSSETLASWTDIETATGTVSAGVIPAPQIVSCKATNAVLSSNITVKWTLADPSATTSDFLYSRGSSLLSLVEVSLLSDVSTSAPVAGVYTTVFSGGLLSNTLSGPAFLGIQYRHSSGWTSKPSVAQAIMPALVGTADCPFTNG